mmetsp:Transcript_69284/g.223914  ORF Transcript_69284/g.223914 Transcript_69284/m.223914 type:complete len:260 (+) Transcript_69284:167-946(+)
MRVPTMKGSSSRRKRSQGMSSHLSGCLPPRAFHAAAAVLPALAFAGQRTSSAQIGPSPASGSTSTDTCTACTRHFSSSAPSGRPTTAWTPEAVTLPTSRGVRPEISTWARGWRVSEGSSAVVTPVISSVIHTATSGESGRRSFMTRQEGLCRCSSMKFTCKGAGSTSFASSALPSSSPSLGDPVRGPSLLTGLLSRRPHSDSASPPTAFGRRPAPSSAPSSSRPAAGSLRPSAPPRRSGRPCATARPCRCRPTANGAGC